MNPTPANAPLHHQIPVLAQPPILSAAFADPIWGQVPALTVGHFHARSSDHRPDVRVRVAASATHLHFIWQVSDRLVLSRVVEPNGSVCTDSCVEFFVAPLVGSGYFNLEINAGGTVHCSYIEDPNIVDGGFAKMHFLPVDELNRIAVRSTLPAVVDPELPGPLTWELAVAVPLDVFAKELGQTLSATGTWRGNFYKCADHSSGPHWASWSPIGERLAFHQPSYFGYLRFS